MFTLQQIQEISKKLSAMCKRDSDFKPLDDWTSISKKDFIAFVKDGKNRLMTLDQLYTFVRQNINGDIGDALHRIEILEEKVMDINRVLSTLTTKYTLTVIPVTPNATVFINGIKQSSLQVVNGSTVNVKVQAEGYVTYEEFILVDKDITLKPELNREQATFTVSPIPNDCTVRLNGVARKSITVDKGSVVTWRVSKSGYIPKSGSIIVTESTSMQVSLDVIGENKINFTVNVISPLDAVVTINGETTNSIIVDKNSEVTWSVEAPHYESKNGTQTVNEDTVVDVTLVANKYTLTINPTPTDAVVELNGEVKNSITSDYNTDVSIKVSKKGYKTYTEKYKIVQTETKNVILEVEEFVDINSNYMEFTSGGESKTLQIESNTSWNID